MSSNILNTDVEIRSGAAGQGVVKYDTGLFLGGMPAVAVTADITLNWSHRGKLIRINSTAAARAVTLPAGANVLDGTLFVLRREGANAVTLNPTGGATIEGLTSYGLVATNSYVLLVYSASGTDWKVVESLVPFDGTAGNLLTITADGKMRAGLTLGQGLSGAGTAGDPLKVTSLVITDVHVVADIAARDALADVGKGDIAKVVDADGLGHPSTYIWDGTTWVDFQESSDVISVAGKTGLVMLVINDMTDVDTVTVAPVIGEALVWNGTNWVPGPAGRSFAGNVTTTPGTPVSLAHNLNTNTVSVAAINNATGAMEGVQWAIVDANTISIDSNTGQTYRVRVVG